MKKERNILDQTEEGTFKETKEYFGKNTAKDLRILIAMYVFFRLFVNKYVIFIILMIPQTIALVNIYDPGDILNIFGFALVTHFALYLYVIGGFSMKKIDAKHRWMTWNIRAMRELRREKLQDSK